MDTEIKLFNHLSLSSIIDKEAELIPLMTEEDEERLNAEAMPEILSILPLRNTVLFPGVVIPITVGRDKSIKLIKDANEGNKTIGVIAQKDPMVEDPTQEDLNLTGTEAKILRTLRMPDGNTTVIIQGQKRFDIQEFTQEDPYFKAVVSSFQETKPSKGNKEFAALVESVKDVALQIIKDSPNIPSEASFAIKNIQSDSFLVNFVASNMNIDVKEKQKLLEQPNLEERTKTSLVHLNHEINMIQMKNEIQNKVRVDIDEQQR
jgi:ATP-dependent Lon protease